MVAKKVWLSIPEYSKYSGLSSRYIHDLINNGKIPSTAHRPKGARRELHKGRVDEAISNNVNHNSTKKRTRKKQDGPFEKIKEIPTKKKFKKLSFTDAQALKAQYGAELLELQIKEKKGELVKASDIDAEFFNIARTVRDAILNVPNRISAELAGITDQHIINEKLTTELTAVLKELSR